jgi:hypothetical protein
MRATQDSVIGDGTPSQRKGRNTRLLIQTGTFFIPRKRLRQRNSKSFDGKILENSFIREYP